MCKVIFFRFLLGLLVFVSVVSVTGQTTRPSQTRTEPKSSTPAPSPKSTEATQRHFVIINVKNGAAIQGTFIQANNDIVEIEVENARHLSIRMDEVISLVFLKGNSPNENPKIETEGTKEAAQKAIASLRAMATATEVGVSISDYGNRLIELRTIVEGTLSKIQDGELKNEIELALAEYKQAHTIWTLTLKIREIIPGNPSFIYSTDEPLYSLIKKNYPDIKPLPGYNTYSRRMVLSHIWELAKKHLDNALERLPK